MKRGAVSLLALMLVTGAAWAQDATTDGTGDAAAQTEAQAPADAPADAPAAPADAAPAIPDEVLAILNDETPLANLDPGQLRKRMRAAQGFAKQQGLPDDVRARLQDVASAARAELDAREAAAQQPADAGQSAAPADVGGERPAAPVGKRKKQPQQQPADQAPDQAPAAADQQQTQNPPADAAPAADAGDAQAPTLPRPLVSLLTDDRPVSGLSDEDLQNKLRMAKALKKRPALPEDVSQQLESIIAAAEAETQKRAAGTPQVEPPKQADAPPPAAQPAQTDAGQKPATPDAANVQQLDANPANPEAEKKAKAFLAGNLDPNSLNDDDLRNRLDAMRDLLAENELSLPTERALRKELRDERDVLRARVEKAKAAEEAKKAAAEAAAAQAQQQQQSGQKPGQKPGQQPGQQPGMKGPKIVIMPQITINTPIPKILADRRRSEDLTDDELRRRIEVYRD
ncbi:MAG: hypothetical protein U1E15_11485, partial [Hyphomicrobiales bacterium]